MSSNVVKYGGISALIAGVLYVMVALVSLVAPQATVFVSVTDYLIEALFVGALLGTLGALVGLHTAHHGRSGWLGTVGAVTTVGGYTLLAVAAAATLLAGREALDAVFPLGVLAVLAGSILLGSAVLRARVLAWWCGILLIGGFPLSVAVDVAVSGAGSLVLGVVWTLVGCTVLAKGAPGRRAVLGETAA